MCDSTLVEVSLYHNKICNNMFVTYYVKQDPKKINKILYYVALCFKKQNIWVQ